LISSDDPELVGKSTEVRPTNSVPGTAANDTSVSVLDTTGIEDCTGSTCLGKQKVGTTDTSISSVLTADAGANVGKVPPHSAAGVSSTNGGGGNSAMSTRALSNGKDVVESLAAASVITA